MNDLEHFSLRWNNFHSNMSSGFCALLQEDALVDVTLAAEGRVLQAHKLVLSVCSPYFKQIFAANPCKHPIVILKDVHHKQLSDLLNFMYQGEVNVRQEELATFLKTAELLQIKGLTEQEPEASHPQTHGNLREDRQITSFQKQLSIPKSRQLPVRRIRHSEKPIPVASLPDVPSSPAPSPPPSKRSKSSSSPINVNEENDKQDDDRGMSGNEEQSISSISQVGNEELKKSIFVKLEPSAEFETQSCSTALCSQDLETGGGEKRDPLPKSILPFTSTPIATNEGSQKTDNNNICNRTPQRLSTDVNASAASSSGLTITTSENNSIPASEQGYLVPQYVHSRKGGLQLVLEGFLYTVHQQQGRNKYWRCVERGKLGCQGYCKTFMVEEGEVVQRLRPHNHGRQDDKIRERVNATRLRLQILHSLSQQNVGISNQDPSHNFKYQT